MEISKIKEDDKERLCEDCEHFIDDDETCEIYEDDDMDASDCDEFAEV